LNDEPERLLTPEQAAERLSISPLTVKDWLRSGKLPVTKVGDKGLLRIRERDLNDYIRDAAAKSRPTSD